VLRRVLVDGSAAPPGTVAGGDLGGCGGGAFPPQGRGGRL